MKKLFFLICLLAASLGFGTTLGISFLWQPLTTRGTDQDSKIIITRIPVITGSSYEGLVAHISAPNKLPQPTYAHTEDSNLLSCLGITVSAECVSEPGRCIATLDLSEMKPAAPFALTDQAVVEAALDCIRRTIDEIKPATPWKIRLVARKEDQAKWNKYEADYPVKPSK